MENTVKKAPVEPVFISSNGLTEIISYHALASPQIGI